MANPETQSQAAAAGVSEKTVFEQLMSGPGISAEKLTDAFKAKDEKASKVKSAVSALISTLVDRRDLVSDNVIKTIESLIAEMDRKLSEQISIILHHEDFKTLEGTWRGLHHLVFNSETDETLKIRIFNIQKKEVGKMIKDYPGAKFDQSPLFKKVYENEFGMPGGQPYGVLIGDYAFDHSAPDVQILSGMAQIASSAHAPFITSPAPSLLAMESWQELSNPRDLTKIFETPEYAAWKSLRNSEDSRYIGMAMPRFLSRIPYGAKTNPVDDFNFEEDTEGADHTKYVWSNAAYAMGTNITRSFKKFGWTTCIRGLESGGIIEGLPVHTFPTDDGGVDMKCPTEIAITDRREAELAKNGFMPPAFCVICTIMPSSFAPASCDLASASFCAFSSSVRRFSNSARFAVVARLALPCGIKKLRA